MTYESIKDWHVNLSKTDRKILKELSSKSFKLFLLQTLKTNVQEYFEVNYNFVFERIFNLAGKIANLVGEIWNLPTTFFDCLTWKFLLIRNTNFKSWATSVTVDILLYLIGPYIWLNEWINFCLSRFVDTTFTSLILLEIKKILYVLDTSTIVL